MYEASLDAFTPDFGKLLAQYTKEYERYQIDEIVVAAIAPVVCLGYPSHSDTCANRRYFQVPAYARTMEST